MPGLATARHANRAASNTARKAPSGRSPIPPQLARLLRWHLRAFGNAKDGRLFQGARGGPLSESLYGRIWHQARAVAMPEDGTGTQAARRPYDLRHAALLLWLASGVPPAEVAARAGHSVRVLLTIYAHCIPGYDQIASQQIERALRPAPWPVRADNQCYLGRCTRLPVGSVLRLVPGGPVPTWPGVR